MQEILRAYCMQKKVFCMVILPLKINASAKPDFDIEAQNVIINPSFVSVADNNFKVKCYFYNLGKATGDSVSVINTKKIS